MNDDKFLLCVVLSGAIEPSTLWLRVREVIYHDVRKPHAYNINCQSARNELEMDFESLDKFLSSNREKRSFLITDGDLAFNQHFSYSAARAEFRCSLANFGLVVSFGHFCSRIIRSLDVSNSLSQRLSFISKQSDRRTPPNTNLYASPALSNRRNGYIEGVSADMWFGDSFWQYAACTKQDVLACDWLKCTEHENHLYVQAWPEPFSSAEGEQGVIQRRLLKLLFDIDENRPHGGDPAEQARVFSQSVLLDEKGAIQAKSALQEGSGPPPLPPHAGETETEK